MYDDTIFCKIQFKFLLSTNIIPLQIEWFYNILRVEINLEIFFLISSPQLIEFQNNRASSKYQSVVSEMHQKFQERKEDAAIQLHEQLEQLEK